MSSSFRIFSFFLFSLSLSFVVLHWYSGCLVGRLGNFLSFFFPQNSAETEHFKRGVGKMNQVIKATRVYGYGLWLWV